MLIAPVVAMLLACSTESAVAPAPVQSTAAVVAYRNYSFSIAPSGTVHVTFTRLRGTPSESVSDFVGRMFAGADAAGATRLVVDLSATKGGDAFLLVPLVKGIIAREQFTRRGGLIVIVGPDSFSPAQNAARMLRQYAQPIFVQQSVI